MYQSHEIHQKLTEKLELEKTPLPLNMSQNFESDSQPQTPADQLVVGIFPINKKNSFLNCSSFLS